MIRLSMIMIGIALAIASSASAGGVVIAMPAPPAAEAEPANAESGDPSVGTVALDRYGHRRSSPRWNGSDPGLGLGFGAWNWRGGWRGGWAWGRGWRGGGGGRWPGAGGGYFPHYPYYGFGGYRISIGHHFFARRAWNGGYVRPAWAWTTW